MHRARHPTMRKAHRQTSLEESNEAAFVMFRKEVSDAALTSKHGECSLKGLRIDPQTYSGIIDLGPYLDDGVLTVRPHTPAGRVHRLFRSCGLRHLVVTDTDNDVCGIITRKDIADPHAQCPFPLSGLLCR